MGAYRVHLAIFVPSLTPPWEGPASAWRAEDFPDLDELSTGFVRSVCARFPCVFYERESGCVDSMLWVGKPGDEEEAEAASQQARFVIGVHTPASIRDPFYEMSLRTARGTLLEREAYIPLYLGVQPPHRVCTITRPVSLTGDEEKDRAKISDIVMYIETCILSDILDIATPRQRLLPPGLAPFLQVPPPQLLKKYLYCMVGNTESPAAVKFQKEMQKCIEKRRQSVALYQGFWDWESEPGKDFDLQFDDKMKQSHFVIAVYQDSDEIPLTHKLESAFYYHLKESKDGNTDRYFPVLLNTNVELPINLRIISSLDFSQENMSGSQWKKLAKGICDNFTMLQISPFQKFDYSVHRGLNLLMHALMAPELQDGSVRMDNFILHTQDLINVVLNNLVLEAVALKSGQGSGKDAEDVLAESMNSRIQLFLNLFMQSYDRFLAYINGISEYISLIASGDNTFLIFINKYYRSIQLLLALVRKFAFVCQGIDSKDTFSKSIQEIAFKFISISDHDHDKLKAFRRIITSNGFSHLKGIEHLRLSMNEAILDGSEDTLASLRVITGTVKIFSKSSSYEKETDREFNYDYGLKYLCSSPANVILIRMHNLKSTVKKYLSDIEKGIFPVSNYKLPTVDVVVAVKKALTTLLKCLNAGESPDVVEKKLVNLLHVLLVIGYQLPTRYTHIICESLLDSWLFEASDIERSKFDDRLKKKGLNAITSYSMARILDLKNIYIIMVLENTETKPFYQQLKSTETKPFYQQLKSTETKPFYQHILQAIAYIQGYEIHSEKEIKKERRKQFCLEKKQFAKLNKCNQQRQNTSSVKLRKTMCKR